MGNSNNTRLATPARRNGGPKVATASPTVHAVWSVSGGDTRDTSGYTQKQMTKQEARAMVAGLSNVKGYTTPIEAGGNVVAAIAPWVGLRSSTERVAAEPDEGV